jgi:hypothetical protein
VKTMFWLCALLIVFAYARYPARLYFRALLATVLCHVQTFVR